MANLNKVILVGNLVKDIEAQHTKSGLAYVRFTVAIDGPKNRDGQRRTDFSSCVAFGNLAENLGKIGRKGQLIYLDGRVRSSHFTDRNGNEQYSMNINTTNFEILTPKNSQSTNKQSNDNKPNNSNDNETAKEKFDKNSDEIDISDDDMPF